MVLGVPVIFYFFGAGKMGGLALERPAAEPRRTEFSTGHSVPISGGHGLFGLAPRNKRRNKRIKVLRPYRAIRAVSSIQ